MPYIHQFWQRSHRVRAWRAPARLHQSHLHPNWQVKYAEILVILAMNLKVKILLNSHSPYFIDAIKIYSEKYRCNTRFYSMVDSNERTSKILLDKTNELSFIYKKLTEAYEILKQVEFSDV